MQFMGLDLSLTSTGYSLSGDTGVITTSLKGPERLHFISSVIIDICKEYGVDMVVVEGYSFSSRNSQAHSIGELGGSVRMRLWENKIPFVEVPPTCRAKFATGKGNAGKNEVISCISARTGIAWSGAGADDMCDAWILEQMAIAKIGESEYDWPLANLSAMDKVDWSSLNEFIGKESN